ncbi:MAG: DUF885 domain-containing protein [Bacteroidetes bacterium]|nr:MAG: DUF885 domain-containing protein [Bacteroidota bacterium]
MKRFFLAFITVAFLLPVRAQESPGPDEILDSVIRRVDAFRPFDRSQYPLGLFTEERYRKEADFARQQLQDLSKVDTAALSETNRISWELLRFTLQDEIDRYRFKMHLNPIQADQGFHLNLNYRIRPLLNYDEVRDYLKMMEAIPAFVDQHFQLMREGLRQGISQPKIIFEGYQTTWEDHIVSDYRQSPFYGPLENLPSKLDAGQRDSVRLAGQRLIMEKVVPGFRKIKKFFEEEYLPETREAIGVSQTPDGAEFYQNRINFFTTDSRYTARDIYEIGMREVGRIESEMNKIIDALGYEGSFREFLAFLRTDPRFYAKSAGELLKEARDIAKRIDGELPRFFKTLPRRPYGVKPVPDAIAPKYTGGRYVPPRSPAQSGTYLVNTYKLGSRPLYTLPALTAHEAVPGHHLQGALNRELSENFPGFRRRLYLSAFGEGWGLYSEYLAADMGIYRDPYEKFGQLTYEMWRACRLVVDTGIHALGWSREEAVRFMEQHTALSLHEINTETDRYIAWPGQALSYKMGEITIRELRAEAEEALGAGFDIREFHEVILGEGTVTLPILRRRVADYVAARSKS